MIDANFITTHLDLTSSAAVTHGISQRHSVLRKPEWWDYTVDSEWQKVWRCVQLFRWNTDVWQTDRRTSVVSEVCSAHTYSSRTACERTAEIGLNFVRNHTMIPQSLRPGRRSSFRPRQRRVALRRRRLTTSNSTITSSLLSSANSTQYKATQRSTANSCDMYTPLNDTDRQAYLRQCPLVTPLWSEHGVQAHP